MTILPNVTHGTNAGYNAGCKCLACCDAHATYRRETAALRKAGWSGLTDAAPALKHIKKLQRQGCTLNAIALSAGVPRTTVWRLRKGDYPRIFASTSDAILASNGRPRIDGITLPRSEAAPIVRAMRDAGYSIRAIAKAAGVSTTTVELRNPTITPRTLRKFEAAAERLGVTIPDGTLVALDPDALRAAPVRPQDDATRRAFDRIVSGQERVRLHVAQRVCEESGIELEEAIA